MPAVPGSTYYVTSYVSSFTTTSAYKSGTDLGGSTTTVITIDNESPANPTSATGVVTAAKQFLLTYTNPSTTDATSTIVLRSTSQVADTPVEGTSYSAGNTIGAATVVCVNNNITLSGQGTCLDTTASRSTNYYYKIFSKDNNNNYSSGLTPSGLPFYIPSPKSAAPTFVEAEVTSGATTTQSGGGQTGGGSGNSDGGGAGGGATTTQGGGGQGGGGGDSGNLYKPSNLAGSIGNTIGSILSSFFTRSVTGNPTQVQASTGETVPTVEVDAKACSLRVLGICVASTLPWR
jgi:hypothetical protein